MKTDFDWQGIAREEIRFFGNVSAAISHEINNRFAVINEKAGLLQDLAATLARGKEVDPERFEVQSSKIVDQVRLAKQIVGNLNRFAHSADVEHAEVDVAELLGFVVDLYARKAEMVEAELSVSESSEAVHLTTSPFVVETLIGRGIDIVLSRVGEAGAVDVGVAAAPEGVTVRFGGLVGLTEPIEFSEPSQAVSALLEWFGARYRAEPDGTALLLDIPNQERLSHGRTA